jgi:hypothetical protein
MKRALIGLGLLGAALAACGGQPPSDTSVGVATSDLVELVQYQSGGCCGVLAGVEVVSPMDKVSQPTTSYAETEAQEVTLFNEQNHTVSQPGDTLTITTGGVPSIGGREINCQFRGLQILTNGSGSGLANRFPSSFGVSGKSGSFQYINVGWSAGAGPICVDEGGSFFHASGITVIPVEASVFDHSSGHIWWRVDLDYPSFNLTRRHLGDHAGNNGN